MRNPNRPDVPKEFLKRYYGPDSDPKERKDFEEWIRAKREKLKKIECFRQRKGSDRCCGKYAEERAAKSAERMERTHRRWE